jgi:hypothetical protein
MARWQKSSTDAMVESRRRSDHGGRRVHAVFHLVARCPLPVAIPSDGFLPNLKQDVLAARPNDPAGPARSFHERLITIATQGTAIARLLSGLAYG